jgi:hypothetical protein
MIFILAFKLAPVANPEGSGRLCEAPFIEAASPTSTEPR